MRVERRGGIDRFVVDYQVDDEDRCEVMVSSQYSKVSLYITEDIPSGKSYLEGEDGGCLDLTAAEAREVAKALLKAAENAEMYERLYE